MNNKKIVFMGTPDFASESLNALYKSGYNVSAVFTQPDKPKNRGMKMTMSPVKELALAHNTPVYQPETLKDGEAFEILRELSPDLIVAVAYGKLLPKNILDLPNYGCINIHGSILPKYRGAAPIQWTVLNGDEIAGVTAMYMGEGMDTGDIISTAVTAVLPEETAGELFDRLAIMGGELLCHTVDDIFAGKVLSTPQDEALATYAPPLNKSMCPIDWKCGTSEILNKIRGMNPWPIATAELLGKTFKIYKAVSGEKGASGEPGNIISADKRGITIACADGSVTITELQVAGGTRMKASDYLRGHPICL